MMVGGYGNSKPADDTIVAIVNEVRPHIETEVGSNFNVFEPISYTSQVVAGTNFRVKIKVDDDKYIHATIFRSLPHAGSTLSLSGVNTNVNAETAL